MNVYVARIRGVLTEFGSILFCFLLPARTDGYQRHARSPLRLAYPPRHGGILFFCIAFASAWHDKDLDGRHTGNGAS